MINKEVYLIMPATEIVCTVCGVGFPFTEEEQEAMEEWLGENSYFDLEEDGWIQSEAEMIIDCEPSIERID